MGLTKNSTGIKILSSDNTKNLRRVDYEIGLAGNPNVGKSTVFNSITGLNQHTGNWPGKTVSNAEGYYEYKGVDIKVVDLPGTYSLLSNSEEEEIARDYICFDKPDLVVVVADATSLERNLNLFFQISEITDKVILCVNLIDEAKKKGINIKKTVLEDEIGSCVVLTAARKNIGISELKEAIFREVSGNASSLKEIKYDDNIENGIALVKELIEPKVNVDERKLRWMSLRLLEGNKGIVKTIREEYKISKDEIIKIESMREAVNLKTLEDSVIERLVVESEEIAQKVAQSKSGYDMFNRTLDKVLVSKVTGIPIMILLLLLILFITITLANYPSQLLTDVFAKIEIELRNVLLAINLPKWISGMLVDGIYVTLAWVVSVMLPPMAIFFPMFTLLEDLGYLPRIAFNLDRCFKKCCTCGKQALTMCMGLGCNAAGVIGCRIISSPRERLIAIITNVFMPCNGRFPILITIASIFIGGSILGGQNGSLLSAIAVTCVIVLGVVITLIISKVLSKTILKGTPSNFILELPPYRRPQVIKVLIRSILDRTLYVLGRAVAVAIPAGAVIWIFANIPLGDGTVLSICANFLEPFGKAIGLDGYILMAFILGFPANEIVMPIIIMSYLRMNTLIQIDNLLELKELLIANGWTLITAINMMILCLLHYPCATTLWTIKKETNSWKWTAISLFMPTAIGLGICFVTTQIWRLFV